MVTIPIRFSRLFVELIFLFKKDEQFCESALCIGFCVCYDSV